MLYNPKDYSEAQAEGIVATIQKILPSRRESVVDKLRAIANAASNIPPHQGKGPVYPIISTFLKSFLNENLAPNSQKALFYA